MMRGPSPWTPELKQIAMRMYRDEGKSAQQISDAISTPHNPISRCAVIGKMHRCGLHLPTAEKNRRMKRSGKRARARKSPMANWKARTTAMTAFAKALAAHEATKQKPAEAVGSRPPVPLVSLAEDDCRWIVGRAADPGTGQELAAFCPGYKVTGSPYCLAHSRLALSPHALTRRNSAL